MTRMSAFPILLIFVPASLHLLQNNMVLLQKCEPEPDSQFTAD